MSSGAKEVQEAFEKAVGQNGLKGDAQIHGTGCLGLCHAGPLARVEYGDPGRRQSCLYERLTPQASVAIVANHLRGGKPVEALLCPAEAFFRHQTGPQGFA